MMSISVLRTAFCVAVVFVVLLRDARSDGAEDKPRPPAETSSSEPATVRVATVQAKRRLVEWRITDPAEVLAAVDKNLKELEEIVHKAGEQKCDVLAFPEDTLGLLNWYGVNEQAAMEVLPEAVSRMLDRLGRAAAAHRMYLVVCSDFIESDGATYNTAFFLGRDGKLIGRYHKTCPTWFECGARNRGQSLPVFPTPDLGTVGMLICYDLVFPETARSLALAGADMIFFPTMGGAAVGDDDIGLQALRVRAAENHVYLVVAFRGSGSMIISPRGKIIARAEGPDGLAIADINPLGGRQGGDAMNHQPDMRARLFRERNPAAFGILTDPNPPVLNKVPINITQEEAGRLAAKVLTIGEEEFRQAESLERADKTAEAMAWWLVTQPGLGDDGIASKHPGDMGIENDPAVIFFEKFDERSMGAIAERWETVHSEAVLSLSTDVPKGSGDSKSLLLTHVGGKGGRRASLSPARARLRENARAVLCQV